MQDIFSQDRWNYVTVLSHKLIFMAYWFLLNWRVAQNRMHTLQWRHNEPDGVSNHQPHDCLLKRLFRRRSKKASKLRVTGLCAGNLSVTGESPAQRASNTENVSIWWRHHAFVRLDSQHRCLIVNLNSLHPGRCGGNFKSVNSKRMLRIKLMGIFLRNWSQVNAREYICW